MSAEKTFYWCLSYFMVSKLWFFFITHLCLVAEISIDYSLLSCVLQISFLVFRVGIELLFWWYVLVIMSSIVLKVGMWWTFCAAGNLKLEKIKIWGGMVVVSFRRRRLVQLLRGTRFSSNEIYWNMRYDATFLLRSMLNSWGMCWLLVYNLVNWCGILFMQGRAAEHCTEASIINWAAFQWRCRSRSSILVWTPRPILCSWDSWPGRGEGRRWSCLFCAAPGEFSHVDISQR